MNVLLITTCVPGASRTQKKALDPLELELHVVNCPVWVQGTDVRRLPELLTNGQSLQPRDSFDYVH